MIARQAERRPIGRAAVCCALLATVALTGCAGSVFDLKSRPGEVAVGDADRLEAVAERIRKDPIGYLREAAAKAAALKQYTLTFTRVERRGLIFKSLKGPERIKCWFRREPFSIRMKWLDPDVKYGESTYVEGRRDDKVRFVPRHGLFGLPPTLTEVDLRTPVRFGEALRPVDQWGLEQLMLQTLKSIEEVEAAGGVVAEYRGIVTLPEVVVPAETGERVEESHAPESGEQAEAALVPPEDGRLVHYIHNVYPRPPGEPTIQELYFDVETDLPAGVILRHDDGRLHAAYFYEDLNTDVALTDEDFLLDAEKERREDAGADVADQSGRRASGDVWAATCRATRGAG